MRRRLIIFSVFIVTLLFLADSRIRNNLSSTHIAAALAVGAIGFLWFTMPRTDEHIRGRQIVDAKAVRAFLPVGETPLRWNGINLPPDAKSEGFLYLGQTGSGKTICLQVLLNELLTNDKQAKAVLHDFKMNFRPFLLKLGIPETRIKILNPYDRRAVAWDIQADCPDWDAAFEIAKGFIPELPNEGKSAFFRLGARFLLAGVIRYFLLESREKEGFEWNLRDVVESAKDKAIMNRMFTKYAALRTNLTYLNRDNDDILATLYQPLDELGAIPNLWKDKPKSERISFYNWADNDHGEILLLGYDPSREASLSMINSVMLNRQMKATLRQRKQNKALTVFGLDEFHALRRITAFETFVSVCRDFNVCVAVATQDIAQIDALYGDSNRSTIMTNLTSKTFLKCSGDAAEWATRQLGQREVRAQQNSENITGGTINLGLSLSDQMKPLVIATQFDLIPRFIEAGVRGFGTSSYFGDVAELKLSKEGDVLRPVVSLGKQDSDYQLEDNWKKTVPQPFEDDDLRRLGLEEAKKEKEAEKEEESKSEEAEETEEQRRFRLIAEGKTDPTQAEFDDAQRRVEEKERAK